MVWGAGVCSLLFLPLDLHENCRVVLMLILAQCHDSSIPGCRRQRCCGHRCSGRCGDTGDDMIALAAAVASVARASQHLKSASLSGN